MILATSVITVVIPNNTGAMRQNGKSESNINPNALENVRPRRRLLRGAAFHIPEEVVSSGDSAGAV